MASGVHLDFETITGPINDAFIATDKDWRCLYVNEYAARIGGHEPAEMIGRKVWEVFPEIAEAETAHAFRTALATSGHKPVFCEHYSPNLNHWFEHRIYPTPSGFAIFSIDISLRKTIESQLRSAEERLTLLYDHAPVGIAETDLAGRYLRVNRKWCDLTGYSRQELLERSFMDITFPDDLEFDATQYKALLAGKLESYTIEKRYVRKDRMISWVQVQRSFVHGSDGRSFGVGISQDITARKTAEQRLEHARIQLHDYALDLEKKVFERTSALEKSNRDMESFCAAIAHDFRAPLRAMQGFTSALVEDYARQLDPTAKEYTVRIQKASERMERLIQDLLAYGQLTHIKLATEVINLDTEIRVVLAEFASQITDTKATIEIAPGLHHVIGNHIVVHQVLLNLISNALTFVAPDVQPRIKIWSEQTDRTVKVIIQDNGIGIAPEYYDRIFRLFERLHPLGEYPGTGIGLALVKQGLERLGGTVWVESQLGTGSRFCFELPAAHHD